MKTIKCSEKATQMHSTFGAWMLDASQLDDSRYWLAEHFSGDFFLQRPPVGHTTRRFVCDLTQKHLLPRSTFGGAQGHIDISSHGHREVLPGLWSCCLQEFILLSQRRNKQTYKVSACVKHA